MSPLAYLRAFWHGDLSGPASVLGWVGFGVLSIALALAIIAALSWLAEYLERPRPVVPRMPDELTRWTHTERRARSRDLSVITALGLACPVVVALAR